MSINEDLISARIKEINDAVQLLKEIIAKDFKDLSIHEKLSMRYLLIQLVEAASSICLHILLSIYDERAEGYPECFLRLCERSVITNQLALKMSSIAELRNLLVHRYWVIDDGKVYEGVRAGLNDFEDFKREVRNFIKGLGHV